MSVDSITALPNARVLGQAGGGGGGGTRPPKPSREQICGIKTSGMQGAYVTVTQPSTAVAGAQTLEPYWEHAGMAWAQRRKLHDKMVRDKRVQKYLREREKVMNRLAVSPTATSVAKKSIPMMDGNLTSPIFTPEDRQTIYAEKRRLGDTHQMLNISWNYLEPNLVYDVPGADLAYDLPLFRQYVEESLDAGFYAMVMLAGDGDSRKKPDGSWDYSDPVGWTYGFQWLMENFQRIFDALSDLAPWIIWCPGYDGVVPHWQPPSSVDKWNQHARSVVGAGYLNLHLSTGYCVWGDDAGETEGNNYPTPGGQAIDCVTTCMPVPMNPPQVPPPANFFDLNDGERQPWDAVWQIEGRLINGYKRPPDQPADDDPHPPFLMKPDTPRGPFFHNPLEICTYYWVRGSISQQDVEIKRQYLRDLGAKFVG